MQVDKRDFSLSSPPLSLSLSAGYAFLLFRDELAVHRLVKSCLTEEGKLFMFVSSVTQSHKKVDICMHCTIAIQFCHR